jgi:cytochrome c
LIDLSDCKACHMQDKKSIGPSYLDIAAKYPRGRENSNVLAAKIIKGGGGVWGEQAMAAHPQISDADAKKMVDYIFSLKDARQASLPPQGVYDAIAHTGKKEGAYIIQATYSDKGFKTAGSLSTTELKVLRSPKIKASTFDESKGASKFNVEQLGGDVAIATEDNSYIVFKDIDLTGIKSLTIGAFGQKGNTAGGKIEIRTGSPTGILLGEGTVAETNMMPLKIPLNKPPTAPTPVFFVFRNPNAEGKALFVVSTVEFVNK